MSVITPADGTGVTHLTTVERFCHAIRQCGLEPPALINPGILHTFPGARDQAEGLDGWRFLFPFTSGGCYGDWSTGKHDLWRPEGTLLLPAAVREDLAQQLYLALRRQQLTADTDSRSAAGQALEEAQ
ncbi:hypothetical protein [Microbulbifer sp. JSM ZJ756]|uniref:hypothetical protein n=1 Tax=Microbulbifer sp. JSM ZJ756 TaxID=3376191 RepID=UPI0037A84AE8